MPWNNSGEHGARIYALDARGLRPWAELRFAPDRSHAFVGLAQDGRSALVFDRDFHAQHLYEWPLDESTAQFSRARARSVELDAKISDARYNAEGAIEVIAENRWLRRDAAQWIELARLDGHNACFAGVGVCTIDGESGEGLVFTEDGSARSCIWSDQRWACGALARVFAASGALWVTDVSRGIEWGPIPLENEPAGELVAISADARTIAAVDGAHITVFRLVRDR
jgi:hypothetical protein